MDFYTVLGAISGFLEEKGRRYAVIGGVALASYGFYRQTIDFDFVVEASVQEELIGFMETLGYETLERSSGYSVHEHPNQAWGHVDFLYVKPETGEEIFGSSRLGPGPRGVEIPLPKPEHLIAMKVLAIKNNPSRAFQDMADIRFLLTLPGVDRQESRGYFERHGMGERFDEIEK